MYTKSELIRQLDTLNVPRDRIVLMHTSLRSIGPVEGNAQGLLDLLIDYFTSDGGLFCVPTHTWSNLGRDKITLDLLHPESNLGTFCTLAANDPRCIRSENPTHSVAVFGNPKLAEEFIRNDVHITTPTAPESCYGKLLEQDGYILLAGVSQTKNTFLHCAEELLSIPNRTSTHPCQVTVRRLSGEITSRELFLFHTDYIRDISYRFHKYETAFRYHHCITDGFLGNAPVQLCSARKITQTIALILKNNGGIDPLAGEQPIPPLWYCTR